MYEGAVQNLIDELGRLPGVGPKSAQRIAFHILNADAADMARLANAISTVKTSVSFCEECGNVSETKLCTICRDERRDPSVLCVVEESKDVVAIERTRSFTGRYHVLGGAINPLAGVGPEQLRIRELVSRLADERIQEIILAMDPNLEGEATATYLSRMLVPLGVRLSRLASGLPVGGDLEYADEITLGRALEGRRVISEGTAVAHTAAEDFERVNREEEQEREQAAQVQAQEAKQSRRRWTSSMFDDLDSEDSAGSRTEAPATEGVQGTVDEQLIEQVLQEAEESSNKESPAGSGMDSAAESADAEPTVKPAPDLGEDSGEEAPASATSEPAEAPVAEQAEDAPEVFRTPDYEEKIRTIQNAPLRTPKPDVPPLPGVTYVNPWT
ncbi:recombination protein RecR [Rothia sp. HMSC072B04]|jgi:recombination protein recR|uniref:recombination mediator RecR n=1 Tax=unclassified Rothia (in: high G+C Gram-positive bacteria) TaxID=2689056 RepID=UPI0008A283AC|nr:MULTISPECIES: recombination mediator RecR [unclassified Rothia (in: high G+C Gram-positive bacteria)]OFJ75530.1 recombination protein RecR [Rothia sp. HMSC065B04]OFP61617.1 recombination protein RecR [Rothia sp. HMSC076D04]OFQ61677.1 recombination protein RecR [Rothia sp. HMSC072B04]